jgi:hypothetical protein
MNPQRQLRLLTVVTCALLALTAVTLALLLMSEAQTLGVQPWSAQDWWTGALPMDHDLSFAVAFAGALQAILLFSRRKTAWRVSALNGDASVMPLVEPALIGLRDVGNECIPSAALRWRASSQGRWRWIFFGALFGAIFIGGAVLDFVLQVSFPLPWISPTASPIQTGYDVTILTGWAIEWGFSTLGVVMLAFCLRKAFPGEEHVSADSAGISRWRRGRVETIHWSDVRLIEADWIWGTQWPTIRVWGADGRALSWPIFPETPPDATWLVKPIGESEGRGSELSRALHRIATVYTQLPIRTAERSLADPTYERGGWLLQAIKSLMGYLLIVLCVAALSIATLAYRWDVAPWLSALAAVGLVLCALRLLYWHVRYALEIPRDWSGDGAPVRYPILWPTLLALSCLVALAVVIAGLVSGHAPSETWTNVEVIGGAAVLALSGALLAYARSRPEPAEPVPAASQV